MESIKNAPTCAVTDVARETTGEREEEPFERLQHEVEVSVSLYINSMTCSDNTISFTFLYYDCY